MRLDRRIEKYNYRLHKFSYYLQGYTGALSSKLWHKRKISSAKTFFASLSSHQQQEIFDRVSYYNKISEPFSAENLPAQAGYYEKQGNSSYHMDFGPLINCFPPNSRFSYFFKDCNFSQTQPNFVKSRPILPGGQPDNSVILKLDSVRHFYLPNDKLSFEQKKPMAVWRGVINRPHRRHFVEQCHHLDHCDIAGVGKNTLNEPWNKPYMSIREQLTHKYILSVEGVDVATNLKWIFASNSVCMMTRPKYETWFMEGRLTPNYHYVELNDDYSDLEEKIDYYTRHPEEAKTIVKNANDYMNQFIDNRQEFLISLLVMDKYFRLSSQQTLFD